MSERESQPMGVPSSIPESAASFVRCAEETRQELAELRAIVRRMRRPTRQEQALALEPSQHGSETP